MIKNANFFALIVSCLRTHQRKKKLQKNSGKSPYLDTFDTVNINISDIAIITTKDVDYCCIIHDVSKSEAINLF